MKIRIVKSSILLGVWAWVTFGQPALAETTNCTAITSLPYVISTQGVYCLTGNLSTAINGPTDYAIDITVPNVTIDLNSFKIGGVAGGIGTQATGIYANQLKNITIKNGIIRGFYRGILLDDVSPYTTGRGHRIENIRLDQNTYVGMSIKGRGNVVWRNQVLDTGGSTVSNSAFGIITYGRGVEVIDNKISNLTAAGTGTARAIVVRVAGGSVVINNRIDAITPGASGIANGIYLEGLVGSVVRDNYVSNTAVATSTIGIVADTLAFQVTVEHNDIANMVWALDLHNSTQVYINNRANNTTNGYGGGIDGGGNVSN